MEILTFKNEFEECFVSKDHFGYAIIREVNNKMTGTKTKSLEIYSKNDNRIITLNGTQNHEGEWKNQLEK